jgi:restriction system protein
MTMWMVRSGRGGERAGDFQINGIVAFGDGGIGKLRPGITKDELIRMYAEHFPEQKEGSRASWANQLIRFVNDLQTGDLVMTGDPDRRIYLIGRNVSGYEWLPGLAQDLPHARRVEWTHQVARDALGVSARNSLGAIMTLFKIPPEAENEIKAVMSPIGSTHPEQIAPRPPEQIQGEAAALEALRTETIQKADEFIEDAISRLGPYEMQDLVAGILRAMGYRTKVSKPGADRGVDITASPDGLMLQEPRIFVEVKHRISTQITSTEIRSFVGGRKPGDRCLYVSTGGFSKDAHYKADRSSVPLTLINMERLRELVIDTYDQLDTDT